MEKAPTEITWRALLLGTVLAAVLAAANAYLGLYAGMTVSASIPAAVISMAIFRAMKSSLILENNAVQTAASAGEAVAAGAIFTLPALVLVGAWESFDYFTTTGLMLCGGLLGVLFSVPLRKTLIVEERLLFPEGVATAAILKAGHIPEEEEGAGATSLFVATAISGLFKFLQSGLLLFAETAKASFTAFSSMPFFVGANLSPALIGVGYLVGLNIAVLILIGGAISWWIAIPLYSVFVDAGEGMNASQAAYSIWSDQVRFIGVGAMLVGGVLALAKLWKSVLQAVFAGVRALSDDHDEVYRTEKDLPMWQIVAGLVLLAFPVSFICYHEVYSWPVTILMLVFVFAGAFVFSAVAGYLAGLVGSSNNPVSGVTLATILVACALLYLTIGVEAGTGPAAALVIGSLVCTAAAIAGDNTQDLKSGHILGATPYRQQLMQMAGVVAGSLVISPVLIILQRAYGFGAKTIEQPQALAAPQATLMRSVAEGFFGGSIPWVMVGIGCLLALGIAALDRIQEERGSSFRLPVLAVAVGLYLPLELSTTIFLGGLIASIVGKIPQKTDRGTLIASGLITGEALVGIVIAVPAAFG